MLASENTLVAPVNPVSNQIAVSNGPKRMSSSTMNPEQNQVVPRIHGQGKVVATILAEQGGYVTIINDVPYLTRSKTMPVQHVHGQRPMHQSTLRIPHQPYTDYDTTNKRTRRVAQNVEREQEEERASNFEGEGEESLLKRKQNPRRRIASDSSSSSNTSSSSISISISSDDTIITPSTSSKLSVKDSKDSKTESKNVKTTNDVPDMGDTTNVRKSMSGIGLMESSNLGVYIGPKDGVEKKTDIYVKRDLTHLKVVNVENDRELEISQETAEFINSKALDIKKGVQDSECINFELPLDGASIFRITNSEVGREMIDIRVWFRNCVGRWLPTKKGARLHYIHLVNLLQLVEDFIN